MPEIREKNTFIAAAAIFSIVSADGVNAENNF